MKFFTFERPFSPFSTALLLGCLGVTNAAVLAQDDARGATARRVEDTRVALAQWAQTERLISKERKDWALGKELLADRIDLVKREISALRDRVAEAEKSITSADTKKSELVEASERLKRASAGLAATVSKLEARTKQLLERLPDPIREKVKPLSQRIPEDPAETEQGLGKRFESVIGVLNEINKFNGQITKRTEVRTLDDGAVVEVTAIYVGIGQGYFVNARSDIAGVGTSTPDGWVWIRRDAAAKAVAKVVAILDSEAPAEFVKLPLELK